MILLEFNDTEQENDSRVMLKAFFPEAKIVTNIPEASHDKPEPVCTGQSYKTGDDKA